jgi:hypothetical protein
LALLPNGQIVVGGKFASLDGVTSTNCAIITLEGRPVILGQPPAEVPLPVSGTIITVQVPASSTYQFKWRKQGQPITDTSGRWAGTTAATLQLLSDDPSLLGDYDVMLTNECGSTLSSVARVIDDAGQPCIGDYNRDGGVDGRDFEDFFIGWGEGVAQADVNQDGGVDGADVETFFAAWEAGC